MPDTKNDPKASVYFPYGFVLSGAARQRLGLDALDTGAEGAPEARMVRTAQVLADKLNRDESFSLPDRKPARAGELLSLGLLTEVLRSLVNYYCGDVNTGSMGRGLQFARSGGGSQVAD